MKASQLFTVVVSLCFSGRELSSLHGQPIGWANVGPDHVTALHRLVGTERSDDGMIGSISMYVHDQARGT